ncbi:MAG: hypothetical protein ACO1QB_07600 [Verrucomicrobiales bacterium]
MKYLRFCLLVVVSLCLNGCGSAPAVTSYTNPISGRRTDIMGANLLDTPEQTREMIWLNAYRDFQNKTTFKYYLEVIYGANQETGYLDIGPGRSLTIVADGEELTFIGLGSLERKKEGNAVYEYARYDATAADMETIANAEKVTVKVSGKGAIVVRDFTEENFNNFREFVANTTGEPTE